MSTKHSNPTAPMAAAVGGVVAVLGALVAVLAAGAASPVWFGVPIGLGLVAIIALGITIGNGRKQRGR